MLRNKIILFIATGFNISYYAPQPGKGTVGTLIAMIIYFLLPVNPSFYWIFLIIFTIFAIFISGEAEKIIGEEDSPLIVIDEFAGYFFTMAFIPKSFFMAMIGFFLFRIFDGTKIFHIKKIEEKFKGGVAVVLDDVVAGIVSNLILHFYRLVF
ncbi:MAG: phosphatidylglycerophosphatase A [Caldiserica bacterium]|nr:MAG: phosphatidylglycerophosphatase A [Caldisericota bacterium]